MDKPNELIGSLIEKGEEYGKTSLELLKLKTIDKTANTVSNLVSWLVVIVFIVLFLSFLNIAVALWIGSALESNFNGFLIVAGFYGLLALFFFIFRKHLIKEPLNKSIVDQLLD